MDNNAKEPFALPDTFGLWQRVKEPMHAQGYTLDLVISKSLDIDVSSVMVKNLALSDHSCVCFDLLITTQVQRFFSVKKRYINESTTAQFTEAKAMSPTLVLLHQ